MRNEFNGRARASYQFGTVEGNVIVRGDSGPAEGENGAGPTPPESRQKLTADHVKAGLVIIFILGAIANSCGTGSKDTDFPTTDQGSRPREVSDDAVAQVVANKLQQCTTEVVLASVVAAVAVSRCERVALRPASEAHRSRVRPR